uniref:Protein MAK10 homolog n=1 Tax=Panagrolaimus superbus TaxID=310955 RepID=A0A914Y1P3_9BILA
MDLGMIPMDETLGLKYAVEKKYFNEKIFSAEEMIAIFDASFACIASSIDGAYFDQTVIIILFDLGGIAFEEDYNYQCLRDQQTLKCNNMEIINELKSIYQKLSKYQPGAAEYSYGQRIKFLFSLFEALHYMIASPEIMSVDSTLSFEVNFKLAESNMEQTLKAFQVVKDTVKQGFQPGDGNDNNFSWLSVFQPDVNRHLFAASFPKEARLMNRQEGYNFLEKTLTFLKKFTIELPDHAKSVESLMA